MVYDACTNSGAGEDYKDKVVIFVGLLMFFHVQISEPYFQSIALLKTDGQYVAINGSASMWLR